MSTFSDRVPLLLACICAYILYELTNWLAIRRKKRMPPGPVGLPWIGNRNQVPVIKPWRKFKEWNKQYGIPAAIADAYSTGMFMAHLLLFRPCRVSTARPYSCHRSVWPFKDHSGNILIQKYPVLGTAQVAWDLMEKRSDIYSSRPRFIMACVALRLEASTSSAWLLAHD